MHKYVHMLNLYKIPGNSEKMRRGGGVKGKFSHWMLILERYAGFCQAEKAKQRQLGVHKQMNTLGGLSRTQETPWVTVLKQTAYDLCQQGTTVKKISVPECSLKCYL